MQVLPPRVELGKKIPPGVEFNIWIKSVQTIALFKILANAFIGRSR